MTLDLHVRKKLIEALNSVGEVARFDAFSNVLPAALSLYRVGYLLVKLFQFLHAEGKPLVAKSDSTAHHSRRRMDAFVELLGPKTHARASDAVGGTKAGLDTEQCERPTGGRGLLISASSISVFLQVREHLLNWLINSPGIFGTRFALSIWQIVQKLKG